MDKFTTAYIACALWSSTDEDGDPLDGIFDVSDITQTTLDRMCEDCEAFQDENEVTLSKAGNDKKNGHDFWLTRNGHGAGFWDRGYSENVGTILSKSSKVYGSFDLYIGDDGKIHGA